MWPRAGVFVLYLPSGITPHPLVVMSLVLLLLCMFNAVCFSPILEHSD